MSSCAETEASPDALLSGLTQAQAEAVTSPAAPLCILASAGAGKTRVLTRRIAYRCRLGTADARHTLAVTFTRKASSELQARLGRLGLREEVAAGTFHSHAAAQLERWWADRRQAKPTLIPRKSRLLAPLAEGRAGLGGAAVAELAAGIEWAKARDVVPEELPAAIEAHGRPLPAGATAEALASLYARYEHEKKRRGLIDFDDLLAGCAAAIERDPEMAGAQRWRWRHVYVDEFQDLNPLQHRLLLAWLGSSTDLCVVGDANQAIYGWNGADPRLLGDVRRRWPSTRVIRLDANHRCTEEIVKAAAAVLGSAGAGLRAAGRRGPLPRVRRYATGTAEATGITEEVLLANREGRPWSQMAVLARTNAQLDVIHQALAAAGVPVWRSVKGSLLGDEAVKWAVESLRPRSHQPLRAAIADLTDMIGEAAGDGEREALETLRELARTLAVIDPAASTGSWLSWLPAAAGDGSVHPDRAVLLSSFHRAKGLEWDCVWITGVEEGLVPMHRSSEAEERQLLYVAMTRAATELHLSWAESRSLGGRLVPRQPSRWLRAVRSAAPAGRAAAPGDWRAQWAAQRDALRELTGSRGRPLGRRTPPHWPEPDGVLLAALRRWRADTARNSGLPPHVVLHDVTLEALASLQPSTTAQLLAVPGLGPVKAGRYGASLLELVADRAESA